jgi:hypothetical protein
MGEILSQLHQRSHYLPQAICHAIVRVYVCLRMYTLVKYVTEGGPILLTINNPATLDQEPEAAPQVYGL